MESTNARIVNLLRRTLENAGEWSQQLQKIVFSLNNTSARYGDFICTANRIFNGRDVIGIPNPSSDLEKTVLTSEESIREIMTKISRYRLTDTPSLAFSIQTRPRAYHIGERVLVWAERILGKRKLKSGILKIKLSKFWVKATVVNALGDNYMVRSDDGQLRKVHRRQLKTLSEDTQTLTHLDH